MNQYIITEDGFADLDKYFLENKDDLIRIAWKNLKDKHIHPYQSERVSSRIACQDCNHVYTKSTCAIDTCPICGAVHKDAYQSEAGR